MMHCTPPPKIEYNKPPTLTDQEWNDYVLPDTEKGKLLYKANCSGCHGIFTKGKDSIPNFTQVQLHNYHAKFIENDPLNHAVAKKLTEQELSYILSFLKYYRKPVQPGKK